MEKPVYTVGQMSKLTGVPKDTLLYYDRVGLLNPTYRIEGSRYRYYTHDQFWTLDIIHCCRSIGVPVETIRTILKENDSYKIVALLKEYQQEVQQKRSFYERVDSDLDWYFNEHRTAQDIRTPSEITVQYFPERKVIYGKDDTHHWDYHSKFMYAAKDVLADSRSFRRLTGFTMDPIGLERNNFMKTGEYAEFAPDVMESMDQSMLYTIPAGDYACCTVNVVHRDVDFSRLNEWLKQHAIKPELVLVEEAVFQLYWYFAGGYPCNVKVKL